MADTMDEKIEEIKEELANIELTVSTEGYTLADAIRSGSQFTNQTVGWGNGVTLSCALTSAYMDAKARDLVD